MLKDEFLHATTKLLRNYYKVTTKLLQSILRSIIKTRINEMHKDKLNVIR
jgi:hypothetical protein